MIAIERLYQNHFANPEISAEELRQFTEDHLGKLKALPALPANLTALLVPTQTAFAAFDEMISIRSTLQATQSGGTITKDEALQLFRTTVRQREGRVKDKFAKGSGPYAEFFPKGLTEYSKARLGQFSGLIERLIAAAAKYQAQLGPDLLAEFTELKSTFTKARDGQVDTKGDLAQARANVATTRLALELQLGKNLLTTALHHLGHPERAVDYFNQSLLEDPTRNNEDKVVAKPQS